MKTSNNSGEQCAVIQVQQSNESAGLVRIGFIMRE